MDRQILAILLEPIKRELGASDTEMGLLTGFAFVLFFALASVPIARAADRFSRRNIIAVAVTFWSIMTMLSGYAATFLRLAAARVGLGISEAAAPPAAATILSDLFPRDRRTAPLALLAVAAPVGTMIAFTIGGMLNAAIGWRMTVVALGAPGVVLAVVMLLPIREPRRGASEAQSVDVKPYDLYDTIGYGSGTFRAKPADSWTEPVTAPTFMPVRGQDREAVLLVISPRFFETMGTRILHGRDFEARDDERALRVAIVNEATARYYFARTDATGQTCQLGDRSGAPQMAALARMVESLLFGVRGSDAVTFVGSAAMLLATRALAAYWPARRAARLNPVATLRAE